MPTFFVEMSLEYEGTERYHRTVEEVMVECETLEEAYRIAEARYSRSLYTEAYARSGYESK